MPLAAAARMLMRHETLKFPRMFKLQRITVALKITDRVVDGVAVEALEGRMVLGDESNALREKVKSLLAAARKRSS